MLTASGMRQRHMLGKFNRQRFVEHYGLLDVNYNPNQILVKSTDVERTIQSASSELFGMYPPTISNLDKSVSLGKGSP